MKTLATDLDELIDSTFWFSTWCIIDTYSKTDVKVRERLMVT